jgi:tetratricopeptide (TPR) repeat protein
MARELDERRAALHIDKWRIMIETALGHEDKAERIGVVAVAEADKLVGVGMRCWNRMALAHLYMQQEQWDQATLLYEECAVTLDDAENRVVQMELGGPLAEAYCVTGRLAEAKCRITETLALTEATGARYFGAVAWRAKGQIHAAQGVSDQALAAYQTALDLAETIGCRLEVARTLFQGGAHCPRPARPAGGGPDHDPLWVYD